MRSWPGIASAQSPPGARRSIQPASALPYIVMLRYAALHRLRRPSFPRLITTPSPSHSPAGWPCRRALPSRVGGPQAGLQARPRHLFWLRLGALGAAPNHAPPAEASVCERWPDGRAAAQPGGEGGGTASPRRAVGAALQPREPCGFHSALLHDACDFVLQLSTINARCCCTSGQPLVCRLMPAF